MKAKTIATGVIVDAFRAYAGTVVNGVRAQRGDWLVDGNIVARAVFLTLYTPILPTGIVTPNAGLRAFINALDTTTGIPRILKLMITEIDSVNAAVNEMAQLLNLTEQPTLQPPSAPEPLPDPPSEVKPTGD